MRIYSAKLDDIRRARDEWDAETDRRNKIHDEEDARYLRAINDVTQPIEDEILQNLNKYSDLEFEVEARRASFKGTGIEVRVYCNQRKLHDPNSALSWDYKVQLNADKEVEAESGSWSGLNATTEASMNSLKQTVAALEYLNSINWIELLDKTMPNYSDYFTKFESRSNRPNFEFQMKQAELESYIGQPIAIKGDGIESLGYRGRNNVWYMIQRETPKKYVVAALPKYQMERWIDEGMSTSEILYTLSNRSGYQIKKEYMIEALKYPFEILEA